MTPYRLRWPVALLTTALVPVVLGVLLVLVVRPVALGLFVAGVEVVATVATSLPRVRRRTLTAYDDVLVVQRDTYRLAVPWAGVTGVQRRRHQGLLPVEELVCTGARVEAVDSRGRPSRPPRGIETHPARSRVLVSLYSRDWRSGPVGERLRSAGVEV